MKKLLALSLFLPALAWAQCNPSPIQANQVLTASALNAAISTPCTTGGTIKNATITGGTINGASVGATTPSTGAFTTLSTTGAVTFGGSGGSVTVSPTNLFTAPAVNLAGQLPSGYPVNGIYYGTQNLLYSIGGTATVVAGSGASPTLQLLGKPGGGGCTIDGTTYVLTCNYGANLGSLTVGTPIPLASGGTNAVTAAAALTNLGAQPIANIPCPSILDHGGDKGGSVDNTTALANTIAASPSGQACVYFPPGTYAFSSATSYTLPSATASLTLIGAGPDVSVLKWAAGGGLTINYVSAFNSSHAYGLSFLTGTTATGTGLNLVQTAASIPNPANTAISDVTNVTFRGSDGYSATNYWNNAVFANGVSNVNFYGVSISGASTAAGNGIVLQGSASLPAVQYNVSSSNFNQLSQSVYYGNYVQGVAVNLSNFVSLTGSGVVVAAGATGLDQLTVQGSQFNCGGTAAVNVGTGVANVMIANNLIIVPNAANGISFTSEGLTTVTGNTFQSSGSTGSNNGVVVGATANSWPMTVTGNTFQGLRGTGVLLQASSNHVTLQGNVYQGNGANTSNSGTNNSLLDGGMPLYGTTGTAVNSPHMTTGSIALAAGSATVTLSGSAVYTSLSSYTCTANDTTAAAAVKVGQTSGTSITLTGTGTDTVQFMCAGN